MEHHPWSDSDGDDSPRPRHEWSSDSESSIDSEIDQEQTPAKLFMDLMFELYLSRALTALSFCVLMYYAGQCGIPGCAQWGKRPNLPSGHYQRHLSKSLPMYCDASPEYEVELVCSDKHRPGRSSTWFPVLVPQEEFDRELETTEGWGEKLQHCIDNNMFPTCYDSHPIVAEATRPVLPVALFVDALPYTNVDSLIGFWIVNLLTGCRHLVVALRKSLLCSCGCRGWCTFYGIFFYLHWCFANAAAGLLAGKRHDGHPWRESDVDRASMAGSEVYP